MLDKIKFVVRGEWENEPDHEEFVYAELPCIIIRHLYLGNLCGYVGVPAEHPAHPEKLRDRNKSMREGIPDGKGGWFWPPHPDTPIKMSDYSHEDLDVDVHGGLTYSEMGDGEEGFKEGFKWFGFDCAHAGDYSPPTNPAVQEIHEIWSNFRRNWNNHPFPSTWI